MDAICLILFSVYSDYKTYFNDKNDQLKFLLSFAKSANHCNNLIPFDIAENMSDGLTENDIFDAGVEGEHPLRKIFHE